MKLGGGGCWLLLPPPQPATSKVKQQIATASKGRVFLLFLILLVKGCIYSAGTNALLVGTIDCIVRRSCPPKRSLDGAPSGARMDAPGWDLPQQYIQSIVNDSALEIPPHGAGFDTVTVALPALPMSESKICAVIRDGSI